MQLQILSVCMKENTMMLTNPGRTARFENLVKWTVRLVSIDTLKLTDTFIITLLD